MSKQLDLKRTINLPRTDFSMKANLPKLEPRIRARWEQTGLYEKICKARKGSPTFVLHDGPPYANGHIHLGHALNKILKDLIVKTKTMEGYYSPYVPGWDCHGLPIEIKVTGTKKGNEEPLIIRQKCRQYAQKFVDIQKEEFKQLGVFGQWAAPYLTMDHRYEAEIVRIFGRFVEQDSVYRGLKPIHWCISCETALAEAEVEYDDHTSPSVYVKFPVIGGIDQLLPSMANREVSVLIWTTTPWTLPANLAICFHPDLEYSLVEVNDEVFIIARALIDRVVQECGFEHHQILATVTGEALKGLRSQHPWLDRESKSVLGDHVTLEQGTGAVHTAPGHGHDDYRMGVENDLEIYCPVDSAGRFTSDVEHFSGLTVFEANPKINHFLAEKGVLVTEKTVQHSYPHCWRCHNPVIFRATPQWFISMEKENLRQRTLKQIEGVRWIPQWGKERISNMIADRPDWCISRQRIWGVPIVAFYCKKCHQPLLTSEIVEHVAQIFEQESADAWYSRSVSELLPEGTHCQCGHSEFEKEYDILDVWFDSGSSHAVVLKEDSDLRWPADVYLEGGDQYRGWFHSSLLIAVGTKNASPYRIVICNGWTLDAEGRAMSKSRGNVISPLEIMKANGAEILRLWVSSINFTEDARLGDEVLSRMREAYRKIRNTSRFLLGNLHDLDQSDLVGGEDLTELDQWALARMAMVAHLVEDAYKRFEFHVAYHNLYNFCVVDLSNFYLDVLKDRLYVSAPGSTARRAAQTSLFRIADTLVRLLAPILPFTSEEIWTHLYTQNPPVESVHMAKFSREIDQHKDPQLLERWESLLDIRTLVSRALEESREKKEIGNSLGAGVTILCGSEAYTYLQRFAQNLRFLFIVSDVELSQSDQLTGMNVEVAVSSAPGEKCDRCWNHRTSVGTHADFPNICSRCYAILQEMGEL